MSIQNSLSNAFLWAKPLAPEFVKNHYRTQQTFEHPAKFVRPLEGIINMKRVLVIGSSGSGKSTLARQLGATLELPVIHLDRHYWHAGWVGTPMDEWQATVQKLIRRDTWIMDGNYRETLNIRLQAADSVVFLDLPPWICALRAIKRRIQYRKRPRPDIAEGCREPLLDPQLFQFVRHVLNYPNRAKPFVMQQLRSIAHDKHIVLLKSTQDVDNFINAPLDFPNLNFINGRQAIHTPQIVRLPMD
ncbi:AAA family ATPase [Candidatus Leptofilum sp.]|uniref:AAA family ATPase n=1 Tax=Candidatus Leptofilum sp. TaxID=3241576 RepID=UPI003B5C56A9